MADKAEHEIPAGRPHIIERPRLTRLLDEASARVTMLVAPAGYGKTTLARQWLADRPHAWYQGGASSADVAALGLGLAEAAEALLSDVGRRLREWLPTSREPEEEVHVIEQFLAEDLAVWPDEAWFVIDDYHLLSSDAAEDLIRLPLRLGHQASPTDQPATTGVGLGTRVAVRELLRAGPERTRDEHGGGECRPRASARRSRQGPGRVG